MSVAVRRRPLSGGNGPVATHHRAHDPPWFAQASGDQTLDSRNFDHIHFDDPRETVNWQFNFKLGAPSRAVPITIRLRGLTDFVELFGIPSAPGWRPRTGPSRPRSSTSSATRPAFTTAAPPTR